MGALDRLIASGRPFDVIAVVDPSTVGSLSAGVRELLDKGVDRLTLNPNWGGKWASDTLATLRSEYESIAAMVVAWHCRGRAVAVQPFDSALVTIARGEPAQAHKCEAGRSSFAVGPSGKLYGCARAVGEETDARAMGDIDKGLDAERARALGASACPGACACACIEETGDPACAGPVQLFHQRLVAELAPRMVRALMSDAVGRATYERVFQPVNPMSDVVAPSFPLEAS
jgi:radical SAM protein with 4Fe4S-binding SPASM domain